MTLIETFRVQLQFHHPIPRYGESVNVSGPVRVYVCGGRRIPALIVPPEPDYFARSCETVRAVGAAIAAETGGARQTPRHIEGAPNRPGAYTGNVSGGGIGDRAR
jgi:hypothetical protein